MTLKNLISKLFAVAMLSCVCIGSQAQTPDFRKVQTKIYQTSYQTAVRSVTHIFLDNLYTDIRFSPELGLFAAEMPILLTMDSEGKAITKGLVKEGAGRVLGGMFGGGAAAGVAGDAIAGKSESGTTTPRVQATVEDIGGGKVSIRIVFKQTVQVIESGGAGGGAQKTIESNMTEKPELYEAIFKKIDAEVASRPSKK